MRQPDTRLRTSTEGDRISGPRPALDAPQTTVKACRSATEMSSADQDGAVEDAVGTLCLLNLAARLAEQRTEDRLARFGLTRGALAVLEAVAAGVTRSIAVADLLRPRRQSLDRILPRLQRRGFINRSEGRGPGRCSIEITGKGRDLLMKVPPEGPVLEPAKEAVLRDALLTLLGDRRPDNAKGLRSAPG